MHYGSLLAIGTKANGVVYGPNKLSFIEELQCMRKLMVL